MNVCDFGTMLKQLRKNNNLTQAELGSRVGLSKAVVSKYEKTLKEVLFRFYSEIHRKRLESHCMG